MAVITNILVTRFILSGQQNMTKAFDTMALSMNRFKGGTSAFNSAMANSFATVSQGFSLAAAAGISYSMKLGAHLLETENRVGRTFGNMTQDMVQWSKQLEKYSSLNQYELRAAAGKFMALATSQGIASNEAEEMSKRMVKLSLDLSSFHTIDINTVLNDMLRGMNGYNRSLMKYSIQADEATKKTYAYSHGIAQQGAALDSQQKILTSYGVILEKASLFNDDFYRSFNSSVVLQQAQMMAQWRKTLAEAGVGMKDIMFGMMRFGRTVLPILTEVAQAFSRLPTGIQLFGIAAALAVGPIMRLNAQIYQTFLLQKMLGKGVSGQGYGGYIMQNANPKFGLVGAGLIGAGLLFAYNRAQASAAEDKKRFEDSQNSSDPNSAFAQRDVPVDQTQHGGYAQASADSDAEFRRRMAAQGHPVPVYGSPEWQRQTGMFNNNQGPNASSSYLANIPPPATAGGMAAYQAALQNRQGGVGSGGTVGGSRGAVTAFDLVPKTYSAIPYIKNWGGSRTADPNYGGHPIAGSLGEDYEGPENDSSTGQPTANVGTTSNSNDPCARMAGVMGQVVNSNQNLVSAVQQNTSATSVLTTSYSNPPTGNIRHTINVNTSGNYSGFGGGNGTQGYGTYGGGGGSAEMGLLRGIPGGIGNLRNFTTYQARNGYAPTAGSMSDINRLGAQSRANSSYSPIDTSNILNDALSGAAAVNVATGAAAFTPSTTYDYADTTFAPRQSGLRASSGTTGQPNKPADIDSPTYLEDAYKSIDARQDIGPIEKADQKQNVKDAYERTRQHGYGETAMRAAMPIAEILMAFGGVGSLGKIGGKLIPGSVKSGYTNLVGKASSAGTALGTGIGNIPGVGSFYRGAAGFFDQGDTMGTPVMDEEQAAEAEKAAKNLSNLKSKMRKAAENHVRRMNELPDLIEGQGLNVESAELRLSKAENQISGRENRIDTYTANIRKANAKIALIDERLNPPAPRKPPSALRAEELMATRDQLQARITSQTARKSLELETSQNPVAIRAEELEVRKAEFNLKAQDSSLRSLRNEYSNPLGTRNSTGFQLAQARANYMVAQEGVNINARATKLRGTYTGPVRDVADTFGDLSTIGNSSLRLQIKLGNKPPTGGTPAVDPVTNTVTPAIVPPALPAIDNSSTPSAFSNIQSRVGGTFSGVGRVLGDIRKGYNSLFESNGPVGAYGIPGYISPASQIGQGVSAFSARSTRFMQRVDKGIYTRVNDIMEYPLREKLSNVGERVNARMTGLGDSLRGGEQNFYNFVERTGNKIPTFSNMRESMTDSLQGARLNFNDFATRTFSRENASSLSGKVSRMYDRGISSVFGEDGVFNSLVTRGINNVTDVPLIPGVGRGANTGTQTNITTTDSDISFKGITDKSVARYAQKLRSRGYTDEQIANHINNNEALGPRPDGGGFNTQLFESKANLAENGVGAGMSALMGYQVGSGIASSLGASGSQAGLAGYVTGAGAGAAHLFSPAFRSVAEKAALPISVLMGAYQGYSAFGNAAQQQGRRGYYDKVAGITVGAAGGLGTYAAASAAGSAVTAGEAGSAGLLGLEVGGTALGAIGGAATLGVGALVAGGIGAGFSGYAQGVNRVTKMSELSGMTGMYSLKASAELQKNNQSLGWRKLITGFSDPLSNPFTFLSGVAENLSSPNYEATSADQKLAQFGRIKNQQSQMQAMAAEAVQTGIDPMQAVRNKIAQASMLTGADRAKSKFDAEYFMNNKAFGNGKLSYNQAQTLATQEQNKAFGRAGTVMNHLVKTTTTPYGDNTTNAGTGVGMTIDPMTGLAASDVSGDVKNKSVTVDQNSGNTIVTFSVPTAKLIGSGGKKDHRNVAHIT